MKNYLLAFTLVFFTATITVFGSSSELNNAGDCPNEIFILPTENCNAFAFQLPETAFGNIMWDFSDAGAEASGTTIDHTFPGAGTYTVCANFLSMECPSICIEVVVLECNQNCTLSAEVISDIPCGLYILEAFDFPDGAQINWQLDGEFYNTGYVTTFELSDGNHTICAFYETPECPNGVEWCTEINVDCTPECQDNLIDFGIDSFVNQGGPSFLNWFISEANGPIIYSGDAEYNSESAYFDGLACLPDGCYQLGVQIPEQIDPAALTMMVGFNGDLQPIGGIQNFGNNFFLYSFGVNDDCSVLNPPCDASFSLQNTPNGVVAIPVVYSEQLYYAWMVDGQYYSDNPLETFTLNPGEHEICLYIESGFCLEESCQTINVTNEECSTVFLTVNTIGPEVTGLDGQTFTITNSNSEVVGVYTADYNAAEAWTWNTCLSPGCYTVQVLGDCCMNYGPNPDTYYEIEMAGQNVEMSPFIQFSEEVGYFDFSVNSDCLEPVDCEMELWAGNPSCDMGQFEVGSFLEGAEYIWDFGDGTSAEGGHFIEHLYEESGIYKVCVTYSTLECNYTISQCTTVEIECGSDCPSEIYVGEGEECGTIVFEASNFVEGEEVTWIFGDGTEEFGGHFIEHHYENSGIYTVLVEYSSDLCPDGVLLTTVVNVEDCNGEDCPTQLYASDTDDCGSWVFETSNFSEGEQVIWSFGDGDTEIGGHFADHHYDEPGVYTITAQYTSNACPNVTTLYTIIEVSACETDCEEISFAFDSFVDSFGPEQIEYHLYDAFGELYLSGSASYNSENQYHDDMACLPDGCYEMVIESGINLENVEFYTMPFLNGAPLPIFDVYYGETGMSYEFGINSDCNPACTEFSFTVYSNTEMNGPNYQVFTILDENETMVGFAEFETEGPSAQTYSFCLPDGCYTILNDGDCCVLYGQNFAYTGSNNVSFGQYDPLGEVSGYMPFSLNGACEWDTSCEPVQLTVSGNFVGEVVVQWVLESDDYELTGLLPLEALLNGEFVIDWCLPQECFSVTFQSDGPLPMEALLLELYAQQLQEELGAFEMQFGVDFIQFDFGYSESCVVAVNEAENKSFSIYPNPSNGVFTIELDELIQTQIVQVYDLAGRLVHSTQLNHTSTQLDLSSLSAGLYQLTLIGEDSKSSAKIQILR